MHPETKSMRRGLSLGSQIGSARRFTPGVYPEEYLKPLALGQVQAAERLGISLNRLNEIVLAQFTTI